MQELAAQLWPVTNPLGFNQATYEAINAVEALLPDTQDIDVSKWIENHGGDDDIALDDSLTALETRAKESGFIYGLAFGLALTRGGAR